MLPSGNVLFQDSWTHVLEVNPKTDQTVWEYEAQTAPGNEGRRVEIHAFQRLPNGHTMVVESGGGMKFCSLLLLFSQIVTDGVRHPIDVSRTDFDFR